MLLCIIHTSHELLLNLSASTGRSFKSAKCCHQADNPNKYHWQPPQRLSNNETELFAYTLVYLAIAVALAILEVVAIYHVFL